MQRSVCVLFVFWPKTVGRQLLGLFSRGFFSCLSCFGLVAQRQNNNADMWVSLKQFSISQLLLIRLQLYVDDDDAG